MVSLFDKDLEPHSKVTKVGFLRPRHRKFRFSDFEVLSSAPLPFYTFYKCIRNLTQTIAYTDKNGAERRVKVFHRSQLLRTVVELLLGHIKDRRVMTWAKSRLEKLIKAFLIENGSEWVDRDFFIAAAILLYNADHSSEMEQRIDKANEHLNTSMSDVMRVTPVRYTESQVLTAVHKCELLI